MAENSFPKTIALGHGKQSEDLLSDLKSILLPYSLFSKFYDCWLPKSSSWQFCQHYRFATFQILTGRFI